MSLPFLVAAAVEPCYKYIMTEKTKSSRQELFDKLDESNDTGYPTEVLVDIVLADQADCWEELTDEVWEQMKKRILVASK